MENKNCKKCGRPLPDGYKHKKCENCRNKSAKAMRDTGKTLLGAAVFIGGTAITIATKGKVNIGGKK